MTNKQIARASLDQIEARLLELIQIDLTKLTNTELFRINDESLAIYDELVKRKAVRLSRN